MNLLKLIYTYFKFCYFLTIKIKQEKTKEIWRDYLKIMEDKSGVRNLSYKCRMVRMSPWDLFIYFHSENRSCEEKHKSNAGADL